MRFVRQSGSLPDEISRDTLHDAVASYPLSLVVLSGSYATDSTHHLSDVDVAIKFEADVGRDRKLQLLDELTVAIQRATGIEAVDLIDLDAVGPALGYNALRDGVLVYGDRETAIELEAEFLLRKLDFQPVKRMWDDALTDRIREGNFGRG